jgi:signal recognition particle GTPase
VEKKFSFPDHNYLQDTMQIKAIKNSGESSTMIIQGGAGTGKTMTGCKIGIQFCLQGKVVLMAATNDIASEAISTLLIRQITKYHNQQGFS